MSEEKPTPAPQKTFTATSTHGRAIAAETYNETNYYGAGGLLEGVDLPTLHAQLKALREAMQAEAGADLEKMKAVLAVNEAEQEAAANKPENLGETLKKAGAWALDIAQKIGVSLATTVIARSLGLR